MKKINPEESKQSFLLRFNKVELKMMYNALKIDLMSDDSDDENKAALLARLDEIIEYQLNKQK